jgi:hypothetical protein
MKDKKAKSFWPNICCKERNDKTLEVCNDPTGTIERKNVIPFALSQGGNYSRHNLYAEVADTIKVDGYLHKGMINLINDLASIGPKGKVGAKEKAKVAVGEFFNEISLCGPRVVDLPGAIDKVKVCQLFIPYEHAMTKFYNLIADFYTINKLPVQKSNSVFIETMEQSFRQRKLSSNSKRLGKLSHMTSVLNSKKANVASQKEDEVCKTSGSTLGPLELSDKKKDFCGIGYNHLDLSNSNMYNIAIAYISEKMKWKPKNIFGLKPSIRFDIRDDSCPSPLFQAEDISIQQVAMDTQGIEEEWVAVVNLNTNDKDCYLRSELPYCKARDYLIRADAEVKAYLDETDCCKGFIDYKDCQKKKACRNSMKKPFIEVDVEVIGRVPFVAVKRRRKNSHVSRRRRLLQRHQAGC